MRDREGKEKELEKIRKRKRNMTFFLKIVLILSVLVADLYFLNPSIFFMSILSIQINSIFRPIIVILVTSTVALAIWKIMLDRCERKAEYEIENIDREEESKWYFGDDNIDVLVGLENKISENYGRAELWRLVVSKMGSLTEGEKEFLVFLGNIYLQTLKKKRRNREMYFDNQFRLAYYQSVKELISKIYNQKTVIVSIVGTVGNTVVSLLNPFALEKWYILTASIISLFLILGFIGSIYLHERKYQDEIEIRKYGETWVRQEAILFHIERVMCEYVIELNDYTNISFTKVKKKFMEEILDVMNDNEKKFQKNMQEIN